MVLTPQLTQEKGVNETKSLTLQRTQIQGVNGTMDLITSTGSKSDRGFDSKTDISTGCKWDHRFGPKPTQVQGVNGSMSLTPH